MFAVHTLPTFLHTLVELLHRAANLLTLLRRQNVMGTEEEGRFGQRLSFGVVKEVIDQPVELGLAGFVLRQNSLQLGLELLYVRFVLGLVRMSFSPDNLESSLLVGREV